MGLGRLELPTLPLSGVRSSQLSYKPGLSARRMVPSGPVGGRLPTLGANDSRVVGNRRVGWQKEGSDWRGGKRLGTHAAAGAVSWGHAERSS